MSGGFPMVALGDVLTQNMEYIDQVEPRMYPKISVKWWGKGAVADTPTDGSSVKMARHQHAKPGQVIVSEIWAKHGSIGIIPPECAGALVTSHFFLFDIDESKLVPQYIRYLIEGNLLTRIFAATARGTTGYAAIRPRQFLAASIPLPPLAEQRRIVARIEEVAGKIEAARGLRREAVEAMEAVVPGETLRVLKNITCRSLPLGDLLSEPSQNGLSTRPSDDPSGRRILRISAATARSDYQISEEEYKYVDADERIAARFDVRPMDLFACRFNGNLRYVGRFALYAGYSGNCFIYPDKLIRFRVDTGQILPRYLCLAMNSGVTRPLVEAFCATTAGNIGISASNLRTIPVPVPTLPEQRRIVTHLDALQAKVDTLKRLQAETAVELEALLPSVLDRAFSGGL